MKKAALIKVLGTNRAIADLLGISVQAVTKWAPERDIPPARERRLRELRPDLFKRQRQ